MKKLRATELIKNLNKLDLIEYIIFFDLLNKDEKFNELKKVLGVK